MLMEGIYFFAASSSPFSPEDFLNKIFGNFWSLLINLLALIVLFLVLYFVAYKPIRKYVEKRRDYINHNIHDAETAKRFYESKANEGDKIIAAAREEAQAIVSKAQSDAEKQASQIVSAANREAKERQQRADEAIRQQEVKAQKAMQDAIVQVALDASKELLGREVNSKDNEQMVAAFAAQVQEGKKTE